MKDIMKPMEQNRVIGGGSSTRIGQLTKTVELLDRDGNVIDPVTKQIIKRANGSDE